MTKRVLDLDAKTTTEIVQVHIAAVHKFAENPADPDNHCELFLSAGMLAGQALYCDRLIQDRNNRILQLEHQLAMMVEKRTGANPK